MINVVLYQPQKPLNTGNIMRTCMATNSLLHIIGPLTYTIDDKNLKRAGLDYLSKVDYKYYDNYNDFINSNNNPKIYFITRYGKRPPSEIDFSNEKNDYFIMFGKESSGIPYDLLNANLDSCYRLPMVEAARSLDYSNCVAIVVYEALRQQNYPFLSLKEVIKGENFLQSQQDVCKIVLCVEETLK